MWMKSQSQTHCYIAVVKVLADTGFERQLMVVLKTFQVCLLRLLTGQFWVGVTSEALKKTAVNQNSCTITFYEGF